MRTPAGRIALVVGTVVVLVGLFFLLRDRGTEESAPPPTPTQSPPPSPGPLTVTFDDMTTATATTSTAPETTAAPPPPRRFRVQVRNGRVPGGIRTFRATRGERFVIVVRADVADHVHVHGYDRMADVGPGRSAQIALRATIPGRFEIELEDRHLLIARLEVRE